MCSFTLIDQYPFTLDYDIGSAVEVKNENDDIIFGGTIDSNPEVIDNSGAVKTININCVDYSQIADRHLAAYAYESGLEGTYYPVSADASDYVFTFPPGNMIDRNINTYWSMLDASDNDYVSFDLGEAKTITDVYVLPRNTTATVKEFDIQHSSDGISWSTDASFNLSSTDWAPYTSYKQLTIPETTARYFRILGHSYNNVILSEWNISEIYFYNDSITLYAGTIIKDVIERFFAYGDASENIDVSNVADGPQIDKAVFNYFQCSQVFSELADIAGFVWYIDFDKKLYFIDSSSNVAPFSLTSTSENWRDMRVSRSREQYRNKQIIRGGDSLTEERIDSITAVADQKLFEYPFPVGTASLVTEDGTPKTLGVKGLSEGMDYYWSYNSSVLEATTSPGVGVVVELTYQGLFPILITEALSDEILARRAIEGGTGVYESIIDDTSITSQSTGVLKALAYLRKYGTIPKTIEFSTDTPGLRAGQLLTVNIPEFELDDDFLIESVSIRDIGGIINRYKVSAVSGEALGGWLDFFNSLARQTQNINLYDEDQILLLKETSDTVELTDDATLYSTGKPESRTDLATTDFSETDWVHP